MLRALGLAASRLAPPLAAAARRAPPPAARQHHTMAAASFEAQVFGPWPVAADELFVATPLSYAFVNLKPVVPGHVLVAPRRPAPRFADLTAEEVADLWLLAQRVGSGVLRHFGGDALTLTIQDGPAAGQTVAHVHIHVMPRKPGDFEPNDKVYDAIDGAEKVAGAALNLNAVRRPRTPAEMAAEAAELRPLFA
jgi:diadenosine tetraphosphate (Ap4A) HIT family hydrolase